MFGLDADNLSKGDRITPDGLAEWEVMNTNAKIGSTEAVKLKGISEGMEGKQETIIKRRINMSWRRVNDNSSGIRGL